MKITIAILSFVFLSLSAVRCCHDSVSADCLRFDPIFSNLFYSFVKKDTLSFTTESGQSKIFIVSKLDSVIVDCHGAFGPPPYKNTGFEYLEYPKPSSTLKRNNEIFIGKDACPAKTVISIKFQNFWYYDSILPPVNSKEILLYESRITPTYILRSAHIPESKQDDVVELYVSAQEGILGFETAKKEKWILERLKN